MLRTKPPLAVSAVISPPCDLVRRLWATFILPYTSLRYRSALIGIAVHSAQSVIFFALVLALVLKG